MPRAALPSANRRVALPYWNLLLPCIHAPWIMSQLNSMLLLPYSPVLSGRQTSILLEMPPPSSTLKHPSVSVDAVRARHFLVTMRPQLLPAPSRGCPSRGVPYLPTDSKMSPPFRSTTIVGNRLLQSSIAELEPTLDHQYTSGKGLIIEQCPVVTGVDYSRHAPPVRE